MARIPGKHFLHNLIQGRTLLFQLVRRDFQQRFVGSAAGWVWGLIHPLVLLASYTFIFQWCLKQTPPADAFTTNYTLFIFTGFLPWLLFQETVLRCSSCLIDHSNLITKTVFPSEFVPVSIFLSCLMSHLLALLLAVVIIGVWDQHFSFMVLLLPFYMAVLGLFAIGIGWIVASLQVYLRDTAQLLNVVMTFWFWMTPIMIDEEKVPEGFRFIMQINPLVYVVRAYRERLLSFQPPNLSDFAVLSAYAITSFVIGGLFFRHLKRGFADVL